MWRDFRYKDLNLVTLNMDFNWAGFLSATISIILVITVCFRKLKKVI